LPIVVYGVLAPQVSPELGLVNSPDGTLGPAPDAFADAIGAAAPISAATATSTGGSLRVCAFTGPLLDAFIHSPFPYRAAPVDHRNSECNRNCRRSRSEAANVGNKKRSP
jgi:hypothetical protein